MNITDRGKKWEFFNSIWILWSFSLITACVGFFWIGGRTGKRKWIIAGLIYLIANLGFIFVSQWLKGFNTVLYNISLVIIYIGWLAAIIQSFMVRKEYLLRREAVIDLKSATRDAYRNEIRKDYFGNNETSIQSQQTSTKTKDTPPMQTPTQKINLSNCSEQELANLPGVGVALAKKAIGIRTQNGSFTSVQDFCGRLELMSHFAMQIENLAFTPQPQEQNSPSESSGRVIDI